MNELTISNVSDCTTSARINASIPAAIKIKKKRASRATPRIFIYAQDAKTGAKQITHKTKIIKTAMRISYQETKKNIPVRAVSIFAMPLLPKAAIKCTFCV
jgi:hypothetical protein